MNLHFVYQNYLLVLHFHSNLKNFLFLNVLLICSVENCAKTYKKKTSLVFSKIINILNKWNCKEFYHSNLNNEFHFISEICDEIGIQLNFIGLGSL